MEIKDATVVIFQALLNTKEIMEHQLRKNMHTEEKMENAKCQKFLNPLKNW